MSYFGKFFKFSDFETSNVNGEVQHDFSKLSSKLQQKHAETNDFWDTFDTPFELVPGLEVRPVGNSMTFFFVGKVFQSFSDLSSTGGAYTTSEATLEEALEVRDLFRSEGLPEPQFGTFSS